MGIICNLTREAILIPCLNTITAEQATKIFIYQIMPRKGLPLKINSDRGPQFVANFWQILWKTLQTKSALSAPYHPESNSLIERQNKTFIESLRSFVNALQDDWEDYLPCYELAYNNSINPSTGDSPFFLNHGRVARVPVAITLPTTSPAVNDFLLHLKNRIAAARDHLRIHQGRTADDRALLTQPSPFKEGDLVLLNTEHYNLDLPSKKLAPKWIGPLKVLQIRGPNTVKIEVPPRLHLIEPLQNVVHLKPYISRTPDIGSSVIHEPPELVDGQEEYEVEEIIAHRGRTPRVQYLVRFRTYGPQDDLWLPEKNLINAPEIVQAYWARQNETPANPVSHKSQRATKRLQRVGHVFFAL